jgi:branched-subunit amino acid transport protein
MFLALSYSHLFSYTRVFVFILCGVLAILFYLFLPIGIFAALIFPVVFIKKYEFEIQPIFLIGCIVCLILMKFTRNIFISFFVSLLIVILATLFI